MVKKLNPGEPFEAAAKDYNRWQDAGTFVAEQARRAGETLLLPDSQDGVILVKNTLTRDLPRHAVLGLRGSVYDPNYDPRQLADFRNQVALRGEVPATVTSGRFCVLQLPATPGEVVPALVSGVTPVRLSVTSTSDEFADIDSTLADPTRLLKTGSTGSAQILFRPEQTGEQWGVVRLSNRPSGKQVALALFTDHVNPYVTAHGPYTYPSRTASTQDRIFPAYIFRNVTFVDNPSLPGWSVTAAPSTAASNYSEPVFIYSARYTYIPKTTFLLPVFEIDGKWYCDFIRPTQWVHITGGGVSLGTSPHNCTGGTCDDGEGFTKGHPLSYDNATGEITFHRNCRVMMHVTGHGYNSNNPHTAYDVRSTFASFATASGLGYASHYYYDDTPGSAPFTLNWFSAFDATAGEITGVRFSMSDASDQAAHLTDWQIAIDTREALV